MNIQISQGHQPPPNPGGVTVIIDVIRAFTTCYHAFRGGATAIHPVATAEEAFALRDRVPEMLIAGEINALPVDGFDFGNSPGEISRANVRGRELIIRTTNGVAALLAVRNSARVFIAGLVNAEATAQQIRQLAPEQVLLVASHPSGDDDMACAEYLRGLLGGPGISLEEASQRISHSHAAEKFFDGRSPHWRPEDIELAARAEPDGMVMEVEFGELPSIRTLR